MSEGGKEIMREEDYLFVSQIGSVDIWEAKMKRKCIQLQEFLLKSM